MRMKSIILLVISISCGLIASFAVSQVLMERREGDAPQTSGVLVAAKDLSPMTKLSADMIRIEQWPIDRIPPGSIADTKEVEGKFAKQRLYAGEPIIEAKLSSRGKDLMVPPGYRIFDVRVDDASGGSGYISPGDRVDVTGFFDAGNRFPISKSIRIMKNIEVAMIDGVSFRDPEAAPKKAGTIQLLVLEKQYEVLDIASNLGKLKLSLRAPEADESTPNVPSSDTGDTFLTWLKDSEKKVNTQGVATSAVNSLTMIKGMFEAVKPRPQPEERKEMMVITPGSVSIYRWLNGRKIPVMLSGDEYDASQPGSGGSYEPSMQSSSAADISGLQPDSSANSNASQPGPTSNASQPGPNWDPATGSWQPGGFTPVYPQSK